MIKIIPLESQVTTYKLKYKSNAYWKNIEPRKLVHHNAFISKSISPIKLRLIQRKAKRSTRGSRETTIISNGSPINLDVKGYS